MFGLMRPEKKESCKTDANYRRHRMHYCGTCKALGLEYGQRARAVLNFDAVFFAEMLSQLSKENLSTWQPGYQAINRCFTMPEQEQATPLSLQYAAATNVLLSELKTDDNIKDISGLKWKMIRHFFSTPFHKAQQQLENWGLETALLWEQINEQEKLEKAPNKPFTSLTEALKHYAAPSARITALVFQQGAKVIGQGALAEAMYHLGYQFGELVYMLDAFEDYEEDIFQNQFNPLLSSPSITESDLSIDLEHNKNNILSETARIILAKQESISQYLQELPLPVEIIEEYSVRLFSNVTLKLQKERKTPQSVKESLLISWNNFTRRAAQQAALTISNARYANYYLVSAILFVLPVAVESVSEDNGTEVYKWMAGFTGFLGGIGLFRFIAAKRKKRKKRRAKRKKRSLARRLRILQRRMKRFYKKAKKRMLSKRPCWADCLTICVEVCLDEACNAFCENVCIAIEDGRVWPWAALVLFAFLVTILVLGLI